MGWILISRAPMRLYCHVTAMTVLLIQQNHADWQLIIGFVNQQGNDQRRVRRQRTPSDSCRIVSSISISKITDATRSSIIDS